MPKCLTMVSTILWDLDGTLVDSEHIHDEAVVHACTKLGLNFDIATLAPGQDAVAVFEIILGEPLNTKNQAFYDVWYENVRQYTVDNCYKAPQIPQTMELVYEFARLGLHQSIVSNTISEVINQCVTRLNIGPHFSNFIGRDNVSQGKPDAEPYLKAMKLHNVQPENCLVFEDSYTGMQAAKNAGIEKIIGVGEHVYQLPIQIDHICSRNEASWFEIIKNKYLC